MNTLTSQANPDGEVRPVARPAERAWTALLRAHGAATRRLSGSLQAEHGLTLNDYEALSALARADGRRLKRIDLARGLSLTPSGVTRLLEGLERAGLVRRASCEEDLRVVYAELTEAGVARLEAASCGHVGSIRSLLEERLSEGELEEVADLLERLPGAVESGSAAGDTSG